jgi:hypothetical protein
MLLKRQGQEVIHVGDNSAGILDQTGGHHCVREKLQQIGGTFVLRAKINYAGGVLTNRLVKRDERECVILSARKLACTYLLSD